VSGTLLRAALALARRPLLALAIAVATGAVALFAAGRLEPTSSVGLLADPDGARGQATQRLDRAFGAEPVTLVATGPAGAVLEPATLVELVGLEGRIAKVGGVRSVYGPGTFLNQTIVQIERAVGRQLAGFSQRAARGESSARDQRTVQELLVRFGFVGLPTLTNRTFINAIVLGTGTQPKPRMRWLFPDLEHALIVVRPREGLRDEQLQALGARLRALARDTKLDGITFNVSGTPLLAAAVSDQIRGELLRLAPIAVLVMLVVLLVGFRRGRRRLRMMSLALLATLVTAALTELAGLGLSPATVAALPVILGLALDYAVQLQARYWTERAQHPPLEAARAALAGVAPVLTLAAATATAGFLTLTLGSVPLIDRLGWTLAIGAVASLAVVLALAAPVLVLGDRGGARAPALPRRTGTPSRRLLPLAVLVAPVAVAGIALSGRASLESDVRNLVPSGLGELQRAERVQQELGVSGQLRVAVTARDVTDQGVLAWMLDTQKRVLALDRRLSAGPNVAEVLAGGAAGRAPDAAATGRLLRLIPRYFLDAVLSRDRRTAELSFGVPLIPVEDQARLLRRIDGVLAGAPEGVSATPAGLAAAAAESTDSLKAGRPRTLLLAAAVIALILLLVTRRPARVLIPLVPALLAAGVSSVIILLAGLRLSPFSAALEPLVLAVGVEFGLLLEGRYREHRAAGHDPGEASRRTGQAVGAAVAISAATVAASFLVLAAGRIEAISQFGILVAIELTLCAAAAIVLVPRLSALAERPSARRTAAAAPAARAVGAAEG
jgi:predicted RND superfamily exporter protein